MDAQAILRVLLLVCLNLAAPLVGWELGKRWHKGKPGGLVMVSSGDEGPRRCWQRRRGI